MHDRPSWVKLTALFLICICLPLWAAVSSQVTFTLGTTPGNPGAGKMRLWANTATGLLECINSSGGNCINGGILGMTTGAGAPSASCTAPSTSVLALYTDTSNQDLWACVATNTWKKVLSTLDTGSYTVTGLAGTAPSNPASGYVSCYFDSTSLTQVCLDSSGTAFTMAKAEAGAANNFLTAFSALGVFSKARPTCANLSDSAGGCTMSTTASGDASGTLPAITVVKVNGGSLPVSAALVGTNGSGQIILASAVGSAQMAVVNTRRSCDIAVGDTSGSALTDAQLGPQSRICYIPAAATIVELDVNADAGTPSVIVGKNSAGTITNIVSSALATAASGGIACSKTTAVTGINGATTCSATLQNTSVAAGDYLELVSGTAGGTAKFLAAHIIYTVN